MNLIYENENFVLILFSIIILFCIFALLTSFLIERIRIVLRLKLRLQKKERRKDIIKKFLAIRKVKKDKQREQKKAKPNLYGHRQNLLKNIKGQS